MTVFCTTQVRYLQLHEVYIVMLIPKTNINLGFLYVELKYKKAKYTHFEH